LGAVTSAQPASYLWKAGDAALAAGADPDRLLPLRDLIDAGQHVALATDNKPYQSVFTLWAALARRARDSGTTIGLAQTITPEEALRLLTLEGARLCCEEDRKGSLT